MEARHSATKLSAVTTQQQEIVSQDEERQHRAGLLGRHRHHEEDQARRKVSPRGAQQVPPQGQEAEQQEERAQQLGSTADIAHRLGHDRVDRIQGPGQESEAQAFRGVGPGLAVEPAPIPLEGQGDDEEQDHGGHVQQNAGDVVAKRIQTPQRMVDRIREVDHRTEDVMENDGRGIAEVADGRVAEHRDPVVVHERVVQCVEVDHPTEDCHDGGEKHRLAGVAGAAPPRRTALRRHLGARALRPLLLRHRPQCNRPRPYRVPMRLDWAPALDSTRPPTVTVAPASCGHLSTSLRATLGKRLSAHARAALRSLQ